MKRFLKRLGYIFLIPLVVITILLFPVQKSEAGSLAAAYVMMNRMKTGLTSGVEYYIAFETTSTLTPQEDGITLEFPASQDTSWCTVAGTDLSATGIDTMPADSTGDYDIDYLLPGTLTAECSQGDGSSADTITIDGATTLTAGNTYGVKIAQAGTAALGTGSTGSQVLTLTVKEDETTIETLSFGIYLVTDDQVVVSATVSEVPTVTCGIGTNAVSLGYLYPGGSYVTVSHNITTSTSDEAEGYYWCAYGYGDGSTDAGLHSSSDDMFSTGSGTIDLSVAEAEGFGMVVSAPDPDTSSTVTIPSDFSDSTPGTFGALDRAVTGAQLILYQIGNQSATEAANITYGARAATSTAPGDYTETVTFICGGYY